MSIGFGNGTKGTPRPRNSCSFLLLHAVLQLFPITCNFLSSHSFATILLICPTRQYMKGACQSAFFLVFQMKFNIYLPILIHPHNRSSIISMNLKMRNPLILKTKIADNILRKLTGKWILSSPGKISMKFKIV